jgi:hypothetical protein
MKYPIANIPYAGDEAYGLYGLSEPATWFNKFINQGIKNHDGQKLLVEHILNTDKGISDTTRQILEGFLK